jgi:CheY-like chemotaxis protein
VNSFPSRQETGRNRRILVADDQEISRIILCRLLGKSGYAADWVENGLEAVAALRERDFDLVLMNCQMPVMSGYEATLQIRAHGSGVRNSGIPIVAVTADNSPGARERCLAAGMNDYLPVPVSLEQLRGVVDRWLFAGETGRVISMRHRNAERAGGDHG